MRMTGCYWPVTVLRQRSLSTEADIFVYPSDANEVMASLERLVQHTSLPRRKSHELSRQAGLDPNQSVGMVTLRDLQNSRRRSRGSRMPRKVPVDRCRVDRIRAYGFSLQSRWTPAYQVPPCAMGRPGPGLFRPQRGHPPIGRVPTVPQRGY